MAEEINKNKKKGVIIAIIILIILIIAGIGGYFIWQNIENNKSVGTEWGDKYYIYLKNAKVKEPSERETSYGISENMEDATIQFCEIEEGKEPQMFMTYKREGKEYLNIYYINNEGNVSYISYDKPTSIELLYNIPSKKYEWYLHSSEGDNESYKLVESIFEELAQKGTIPSSDVKTEKVTAEYIFTKEEMISNLDVVEGEIPTISKFDETFIVPEVPESEKIDFNLDSDEKEFKASISKTVECYKSQNEIVTEDVKTQINNKVTELETKKEEIKKAEEEAKKKAEEEARKKAEEEAKKGLQVGKYTLQYGTYKFSMNDTAYGNMVSTITLNQNGKFHIKSNFSESSLTSGGSMDCDGTYKVKLNVETYPDTYEDMIEFTPNNGGESFYFTVGPNNSFSDQWHGYTYSGK